MNGFGIGLMFALGISIALGLRSPDLERDEMVMTIIFWSFMPGLIYELYRIALAPREPRR